MNYSRNKIFNSKVQLELLKLNFPVLISILLNEYDIETTCRVLKKIGEDMADTWLKYYVPKGYNLKNLIKKNTLRTFGKLKMQVKQNEDGFSLIFYECPLCSKEIEIVSQVPYCISISGFYEKFFNNLAAKSDRFGFKKIEGTTIKSISGGDTYCEHIFKILEK
ncbi:MAG: hypothetical protein ACTSPY_15995 [Candidatus Helarchaeota archaeon]